MSFVLNFVQRKLVEMMCSVFVASWTGVIKYHGPRPSSRPYQVTFCLVHLLMSELLVCLCLCTNTTEKCNHPHF
jgi:hypothetical protein